MGAIEQMRELVEKWKRHLPGSNKHQLANELSPLLDALERDQSAREAAVLREVAEQIMITHSAAGGWVDSPKAVAKAITDWNLAGTSALDDLLQEVRRAAIEQAELAHLAHIHVAGHQGNIDRCEDCGKDIRNRVHLRSGETKEMRLAELRSATRTEGK